MLVTQYQKYRSALVAAKNRTPQAFYYHLFNAIVGHITPFTL
jgi:hypothetical protein